MLAPIGAEGLMCELDGFEAERLLFAGELERGRELAEDALRRSRKLDVSPFLPTFLMRLIALALIESGDRQEGLARLAESARLGAESGAVYDRALSLQDLAHFDPAANPALGAEARDTFERLGVTSPPAPGLTGAA